MKKRKLASFFAAVLMAMSMLFGCVTTPPPSGTTDPPAPPPGTDDSGYDPALRVDDLRALSSKQYTLLNTTALDDFNRYSPAMDGIKQDKNRYVGMFYFLWLGQHRSQQTGIYDISKNLAQYGGRALGFDGDYTYSPAPAPYGPYHFWGEPLFGYYDSTDEWVIRKHLEMLTFMGLDFLYFDATNGVVYKEVTDIIFPIIAEYRAAGWNCPQVMTYFGGSGDMPTDIGNLLSSYNNYYKNPALDDIWFKPNGKPMAVIMKETEEALAETTHPNHVLYETFEFKYRTWPNDSTKNQNNGFPWIDFSYPQNVNKKATAINDKGVISVSIAQHPSETKFSDPVATRGRGWELIGGNNHERWAEDLNFQAQWKTAREKDAQIEFVSVTGWNEWIAMKFSNGIGANKYYTVDQYNDEYSRDIEPNKNGNKDNSFLLSVKETRGYKMTEAKHYKYPTVSPSITNASDAAWGQAAHFEDFKGEAIERFAPRFDGALGMEYEDDSNRNDISDVRVARDAEYLYFKVSCADAITARATGDTRWMNIHINTTKEGAKDRRGYQYVLNRNVAGSKTEVSRAKEGGGYTKVGEGDILVAGRDLVVRVPLSALGLSERNYDIEFKVSDNVRSETDALSFYTTGDCAPCGRLNYKFGY
ncbi:hypothetical protein FACS1894211_01030 [Clostridia bacterium]|nr:hypothetical protein FACS1894211_01030 [Clostridia bacterium]